MKNGLIIDKIGDKRWYKDDLLHREDGPAIELTIGFKGWILNNKYHRVDGPAVEFSNGIHSWYLNGVYIKCKTNEEFLRIVKMKVFL